jgi:hypothetical protein
MDQSVMNFATSAARASAIPTPTQGMTSYISTTGTATIPQIETYTGSEWQTPYGSTLIARATLSGSSVILANVFSASFNTYKLEFSGVTFSANGALQVQLRTGSTTAATDYRTERFSAAATSVTGDRDATTVTWNFSKDAVNNSNGTITLYNPFLAVATFMHGEMSVSADTATNLHMASGLHAIASSFESLVVSPTGGNFNSGTLRIYGLRN